MQLWWITTGCVDETGCVDSFVHSFHSFIRVFPPSFVHLIHSFIHPFIRSFIHSFIHTSIHSLHSYLYPFVHSSVDTTRVDMFPQWMRGRQAARFHEKTMKLFGISMQHVEFWNALDENSLEFSKLAWIELRYMRGTFSWNWFCIILVTTVARVSRAELSRQEVVILNVIIITNITRATPGGMATGWTISDCDEERGQY